MDARQLATAGVQPGGVTTADAADNTFRSIAIARFRLALELFTVDATLTELRLAGSRNLGLLQHYERQRERLLTEFEQAKGGAS